MARLAILGAGVMGSALAVPAADNGHEVLLVGTPLDREIVRTLQAGDAHPKLDAPLPASVVAVDHDALTPAQVDALDATIIAVSSPGIDWALTAIEALIRKPGTVGLVTKGLVARDVGPPLTYADTVPELLAAAGVVFDGFVGIGGPCIAREVANRAPSATVYAARDKVHARRLGGWLDTPRYRVFLDSDAIGVEACAALKNFFAIGVSAAIASGKNPTAFAFQQAIDELRELTGWLGGRYQTAHSLAGLGDLHVTVGGGRNAKLGARLGEGMTVREALDGPLAGETVEGRDTGLALAPALHRALADNEIATALPLTLALLEAIERDVPFAFDHTRLGAFPR